LSSGVVVVAGLAKVGAHAGTPLQIYQIPPIR
jgi:hypothetical protein